jgi:hypothetical protein
MGQATRHQAPGLLSTDQDVGRPNVLVATFPVSVYQDLSDDLNEARAPLFRSSLTLLSQLRVAG